MSPPNVLFVMTDQQRHDTIGALGNEIIYTPNLDRLVAEGTAFVNAYSQAPVCVAARYSLMVGHDPTRTGAWSNYVSPDIHEAVRGACGTYLPQRMSQLGYRTFGVGKFHTTPWDAALGFDIQLWSEETYRTPEQRDHDDYAAFLHREHPEFDFIEGLMGERSDMYYVPQMSPLPAELTVEAWAADRAVELIRLDDRRPWFGFVSFVGPHPPLAPPIPFNRMYDPDRMPSPVRGDRAVDEMDDYLLWMNHAIYADDVSDSWARLCRARYYGETSYIDECLGRILAAVDQQGAENTLVCFYSDHGDLLGDHGAWQKEGFFEPACRVPFLLRWPDRIAAGVRDASLTSLTDLFGIATSAGGTTEMRGGVDTLGVLAGTSRPREVLFGYHQRPGDRSFKVMVRSGTWKYIYMANGGREQLFNLDQDPNELTQLAGAHPEIVEDMRALAVTELERSGCAAALDGEGLKSYDFAPEPRVRIRQFDRSRGIDGFPERPGDVRRPG